MPSETGIMDQIQKIADGQYKFQLDPKFFKSTAYITFSGGDQIAHELHTMFFLGIIEDPDAAKLNLGISEITYNKITGSDVHAHIDLNDTGDAEYKILSHGNISMDVPSGIIDDRYMTDDDHEFNRCVDHALLTTMAGKELTAEEIKEFQNAYKKVI